MEAGNRCFDQRVPEETNRKIVDHISDINLPYSDISREYLLKEGISPDRIIKTGSPMYEVLNYYMKKITTSNVLKRLNVEKNKYFVVSAHREENINNEHNFYDLIDSLNCLAKTYKKPVVVSTHPRTRKMLKLKKINANKLIKWLKPLSFSDYNWLQMNSKAVLSDSGTINEESSILNLRALNIRETHERPEAMEEIPTIMTGLKKERMMQGIKQLQYQKEGNERVFYLVNDYSVQNVSEKVVRIIISYIDYVRKTV